MVVFKNSWVADGVGPDQTLHFYEVWSGSALLAQACLAKHVGKV